MVADAASATIMRRAGELLRVLAKHLLDGSDSGRQTEALKGAVHTLPSRLETRPSLTGSSARANRAGIVVVAALAANAEGPPAVAITATWPLILRVSFASKQLELDARRARVDDKNAVHRSHAAGNGEALRRALA
jgi:hypothetical protein